METNGNYAIQKQQDDNLKAIMRSDEIRGKFAEVVGNNNAAGYISSVLIAVADSPALQKCTPTSVISSALRAATMRLSVEPSLGHAYLVPFRDKCTLVVGYKGIYQMALRTGQYRYLDLITVYDTDTITQNTLTGMHALERGERSEKVVGYLLYFKLVSGFEKTFYMTTAECLEHGQRYSKTFYRDDSLWKTDPEKMAKKTVMRMGLTKWGLFTDVDAHNLGIADEAEGDLSDVIDAVNIEEQPKIAPKQAMADLGFGSDESEQGPVDEIDEAQDGLFQDKPPKIDPTAYWTLIKTDLKKDQEYGVKLLEKNGGDFEAAYYAAKQSRADSSGA